MICDIDNDIFIGVYRRILKIYFVVVFGIFDFILGFVDLFFVGINFLGNLDRIFLFFLFLIVFFLLVEFELVLFNFWVCFLLFLVFWDCFWNMWNLLSWDVVLGWDFDLFGVVLLLELFFFEDFFFDFWLVVFEVLDDIVFLVLFFLIGINFCFSEDFVDLFSLRFLVLLVLVSFLFGFLFFGLFLVIFILICILFWRLLGEEGILFKKLKVVIVFFFFFSKCEKYWERSIVGLLIGVYFIVLWFFFADK